MSTGVQLVEDWLQRHAGLEAPSLGAGTVARAARDRMEELRCADAEDYVHRLAEDPGERRRLLDRVVVPETWFFRDAAALEALARHVTETWGPAHPGAVFRALSVPCSSGEEPYSLAMALLRAGWPAARLRIDAVDISPGNLERAAAGVYGRNSFRGSELEFRETWMTAAADGSWRVNDAVRACVRFEAGNLVAEEFATGRGLYDAVLCRNLLIYFSRETQVRAAGVLERLMAPDAWLAVGPAEAVLMLEQGFTALRVPGGFLLHKPTIAPAPGGSAGPFRPAGSFRPAAPKPTVKAAGPRATPRPAAKAVPVAAPKAARPAGTDAAGPAYPTIADVQALADAGRLREAAEAGARLRERDGGSAALLFLLAVVAEAAGDGRTAEDCLRKTLYLEPGHAEALAHLALLAEKQGDLRGARALRQRAQRALERGAA